MYVLVDVSCVGGDFGKTESVPSPSRTFRCCRDASAACWRVGSKAFYVASRIRDSMWSWESCVPALQTVAVWYFCPAPHSGREGEWMEWVYDKVALFIPFSLLV